MSLVAVYDALKAANVDDAKATAAVEAIETVREEARLRRMEVQIGELRADMEKGFGEIRAEMEKNSGELRAEMQKGLGEVRADITLLKWMCGGILGLMAMAFIRIMFG